MKRILLITSQFPYAGGEQFLETEIKYYKDLHLVIMPKSASAVKRSIPKNIKVDNYLNENSFKKNKLAYLLKSMQHKTFYKELINEKKWNLKKLKIFFKTMYTYQMYFELFDAYFSGEEDIGEIVVYTYWHDVSAYALQSLKEKYGYKLVSRIHRGDLYVERRPFLYMPLKKQFTQNIDTLYTITESANSYLINTYGFNREMIHLSKLGVEDKKIVTKSTKKNCLHLVSCSFMVKVKRIDKIVKSLHEIALKNPNITFKWTHIGSGILQDELDRLASKELDKIVNIDYCFVGNLKNEEVYQFYKNNDIDVFINVSESEGVPVSIMEAMSCHIPIVAPDVGGISDIVMDGDNGILLSKKCGIDELIESLLDINFFKDSYVRENAYQVFLEKYNAEKNYQKFSEELVL